MANPGLRLWLQYFVRQIQILPDPEFHVFYKAAVVSLQRVLGGAGGRAAFRMSNVDSFASAALITCDSG